VQLSMLMLVIQSSMFECVSRAMQHSRVITRQCCIPCAHACDTCSREHVRVLMHHSHRLKRIQEGNHTPQTHSDHEICNMAATFTFDTIIQRFDMKSDALV
jgi:hypothetical protein